MQSTQQNIQQAAERLRNAAETGTPCDPIRELLAEGDLEAAYAVQDMNTRIWLEQGRRLVGRKIGATSKAVRDQFGLSHPDCGMLFADMDVAAGEVILPSRALQPRAETEIVFVMGENLDDTRLTAADVIGAIDYAVAAIEIPCSRITDHDVHSVDTIADNASCGLFVLGNEPRRLGEFDPRMCGMVMERNGEPVSLGVGAASMGSPISAILWLAKAMAKLGHPLQKGEIVLSGALGPMVTVVPGDVFQGHIAGLGSVRAVFAGE